MQSVTLYGRLLARAIVTGFHNEFQIKPREKPKELHLVTGTSGFSKSAIPKSELLRKWTFGDDAYFIARNKVADVIGKYIFFEIYIFMFILFITVPHITNTPHLKSNHFFLEVIWKQHLKITFTKRKYKIIKLKNYFFPLFISTFFDKFAT